MHQFEITDNLKERFWSKVDKTPGLGPNGDCWEWMGKAQRKYGYGSIKIEKKMHTVHRVSYVLTFNKFLNSKINLNHICDNTKCVNPSHLFEGSQADNIRDMVNKNRHAKGMKITGRPKKSI